MLPRIKAYIQQNNLLSRGDRIVAGVSGGADSVCLLHVLLSLREEYGLTLRVVHINHGIRGEEATRDELFVKELCVSLGIPFACYRYDVKRAAGEEGISEEEAGRKLRYRTFLEDCRENRCNKLAIAHNKNDNAETVLFHLFRGSGITGLSGMEPSRCPEAEKYEVRKPREGESEEEKPETEGFEAGKPEAERPRSGESEAKEPKPSVFGVTVIRPLLCVTREEIEAYLARENLDYLIDSSNLTDEYSRNKIRHRILNYATEEINVQSVGNIIEAANTLKEIEGYLEENISRRFSALVQEEAYSFRTVTEKLPEEKHGFRTGTGGLPGKAHSFRVDTEALQEEHIVIRKGIVRRILEQLAGSAKDLEAKHVEASLSLLTKQVGRQVHLPYGIVAEREYHSILFYQKSGAGNREGPAAPVELSVPGTTRPPWSKITAESELLDYKKNMIIPKSHYTKWFDYDKIENAVQLRTRKEGDYIQINAFGGRKKLKDYFIDLKLPKKDRDRQLLITDGSHVMWIPGAPGRMSEGYKVDAATKRVLSISLTGLEE